ncbi:uncharacterized protein BO80DRAFT_449799 [Aspergillus ibericus CBS 121593]|uniref:Uncharacterized protein n=1 Tax=Aspergillus ibericus CBS 121593 TaxID=1448316 RepID=A0A395GPI1_9EURO|nr:hypothetical protein BO80DRAFT_449799 [Aspergillus ibericus CBS 121593]RAK95933.1 hypothetical protein BO80DRAFT_449799 [Aspergillus ibericus CBS 121593]
MVLPMGNPPIHRHVLHRAIPLDGLVAPEPLRQRMTLVRHHVGVEGPTASAQPRVMVVRADFDPEYNLAHLVPIDATTVPILMIRAPGVRRWGRAAWSSKNGPRTLARWPCRALSDEGLHVGGLLERHNWNGRVRTNARSITVSAVRGEIGEIGEGRRLTLTVRIPGPGTVDHRRQSAPAG